MRRYRLIVFDWDGTLVDSIASIVGCTEATLDRLDLPQPGGEVIRASIGLGLRETVEKLVPGFDKELYERLISTYRHLWYESYGCESALFAGVAQMLEALNAEGYVLAVATAKPLRGLRHDFDRTGVAEHFEAVKTVDDAPAKPHPGMLLDLLNETRTDAGEALMVGDTTHDLEMAKSAGVPALAVTSGSHSRELLLERRPLGCLDSVAALPEWLKGEPESPGSSGARV